MIHLLIFLLAFLFQGQSVVGYSEGVTLKSLEWEHRVLAYVVSSESDRASIERSIAEYSREIEDRDLLFVNLGEVELETEYSISITDDQRGLWRKFWNIDLSESRFVLIGKDGGAKAFQKNVLDMPLFFDLIDAMPMRRAELRERGAVLK